MLSSNMITAAPWTNGHAQTTIAVGGGIAMLFVGDGSGMGKVEVLLHSTSVAGTLHVDIEGVSGTPDVPSASGLPDGTTITNGGASAAITGGVTEKLTLTFATPPTPTGLHWLVLTVSGSGASAVVKYTSDFQTNTAAALIRFSAIRYSDGADFDQALSVGCPAVVLYNSSNVVPWFWHTMYVAFIQNNTDAADQMSFDNKECVGVRFTARNNLTQLAGVIWGVSTMGADQNLQMKIFAVATGTLVASSSVFNQQALTTATNGYMPFDTFVSLTAGAQYVVFLLNPNDTADDISLMEFNLTTAGDQAVHFCMESGEFALATATDPPQWNGSGSGTWTYDDTILPLAQLAFVQDVAAITTGSPQRHPGMSGGMSG